MNEEKPGQSVEKTEFAPLHEVAAPESPAHNLTPREEVDDTLRERSSNYAPGATVERLNAGGKAEQWTVNSIDANGAAFLTNADGKRAIMHTTELALEERAATFAPQLEAAWGKTMETIAATNDDTAGVGNLLGKNRGDIMFLAAERLAANPDADPAQELFKAINDTRDMIARENVRADRANTKKISGQLAEGRASATARMLTPSEGDFLNKNRRIIDSRARELLQETPSMRADVAYAEAAQEAWRTQGGDKDVTRFVVEFAQDVNALAEAESLLGHLRFGTHDAPNAQRDEIVQPESTKTLFFVSPSEIASARATIAEVALGAPEVTERIAGGRLEMPKEIRTVDAVDTDLKKVDDELSLVENNWKLHGKGTKESVGAVVHFTIVRRLREREKSLTAERRAAEAHEKTPEGLTLLIAEDKRKAAEQPMVRLLRRGLDFGADRRMVVGLLEQAVTAKKLHPIDKRECTALLKSLKKELRAELIGTFEIDVDDELERMQPSDAEEVTVVREPMPVVPASTESEEKTLKLPPRGGRVQRARTLVQEEGRGPLADAPVGFVTIPPLKDFARDSQRNQEFVKKSRGSVDAIDRQRKLQERLAAIRESAPETYRAPEATEPDGFNKRPTTPTRKNREIAEDEWMKEGEGTKDLRTHYEEIPKTNPKWYLNFTKDFGGPEEFVSLFNEARARTNIIDFNFENLKRASTIQRWWYHRKMGKAVKEMARQDAVKPKKKRGSLQA